MMQPPAVLPAAGAASEFNSSLFLRRLGEALIVEPPTFEQYFPEAWKAIEPASPMVESWHIGFIFEHLHAVDLGQIQLLDINIPPSHLKSTIVTVVWPTWSWITKPWLRYIAASYADDLAERHSLQSRTIIQSPYYKRHFGDIVQLRFDQNEKKFFENTAGGFRLATSIGGAATGFHCDRFIEDDLINPKMADSKAEREKALRFDSQTVPSRFKDPKNRVIIHVAQRLHPQDVTAQHEKQGGWTRVVVPAEAPARMVVQFPVSGKKIVRKPGDLICPARVGKKELEGFKKTLGSKGYEAQFQQNPSSDEGAIIKRSWWKFHKELPKVLFDKVWLWDTASKTKEQNDFTAGLWMGRGEDRIYIGRRKVEERMEYPQMKRRIQTCYDETPADAVIVEDTSAGQAVIQDLRQTTILPIVAYQVTSDKVQRLNTAAPSVEAGNYSLPEGEPWVEGFIETLAAFPNVPHDDIVDVFSMGVHYMSGRSNGTFLTVG